MSWFDEFIQKFYFVFIEDERWRYLWSGLLVTLKVAFFAVLIGIVLGFLVAIVRATRDRDTEKRPVHGIRRVGRALFGLLDAICRLYLTVIRGTPVVVQLLIIYFVIFASVNVDKSVAAIIAFGINSGAYVAEIVRGGIMSIDSGQMEAGRSLGLGYMQTMTSIILPQAIKNILPALGNEFIVLLKETSVAGYIALGDLTKGADIIRGRTFEAFMPLIAVALIYLALVVLMSAGVNWLERRLRSSDH